MQSLDQSDHGNEFWLNGSRILSSVHPSGTERTNREIFVLRNLRDSNNAPTMHLSTKSPAKSKTLYSNMMSLVSHVEGYSMTKILRHVQVHKFTTLISFRMKRKNCYSYQDFSSWNDA